MCDYASYRTLEGLGAVEPEEDPPKIWKMHPRTGQMPGEKKHTGIALAPRGIDEHQRF